MKADIVRYVRKQCQKHKLECVYLQDGDTYFIHKKGRAVMSFDTGRFYQLSKEARNKMFLPLIKVGLANNVASANWEAVMGLYTIGKRVI